MTLFVWERFELTTGNDLKSPDGQVRFVMFRIVTAMLKK